MIMKNLMYRDYSLKTGVSIFLVVFILIYISGTGSFVSESLGSEPISFIPMQIDRLQNQLKNLQSEYSIKQKYAENPNIWFGIVHVPRDSAIKLITWNYVWSLKKEGKKFNRKELEKRIKAERNKQNKIKLGLKKELLKIQKDIEIKKKNIALLKNAKQKEEMIEDTALSKEISDWQEDMFTFEKMIEEDKAMFGGGVTK